MVILEANLSIYFFFLCPGRARRINNEDVVTNGKALVSHLKTGKQGAIGTTVQLKANFFKVSFIGEFIFYKYHVDFVPPLLSTKEKKKTFFAHRGHFPGGMIFDGTVLRLRNKVRDETLKIQSKTASGVGVEIHIKYVGSDTSNALDVSQTLNIICRSLMTGTNLTEIRRNYFNLERAERIPEFRLSVIPGYHTSIRQHEQDILLNVDAISRVQSVETALQILRRCYEENQRYYRENFQREILGRVVMTTYNNKTYRIDDVDFNMSPADTFKTPTGDVSYIDYYRKVSTLIFKI